MKSNLSSEIFYTFWSQRDVRERRMLLAGTLAVTLAIIYLAFINPAMSGRAKLQKDIPQLRQKVAEMEALSQQFAQFSGALNEDVAPISKETLEASLTRRGVKPVSINLNDDVVRLQLKNIDYAEMMDWLLEIEKVNRITVEEAKIEAQDEAAKIDALLTLKQQRR